MYYSDEEINEQFPGLIAEIWPTTRMKRDNREGAAQLYIEVPNVETIQLVYHKPTGSNPTTGEPVSQPIHVVIGRFQVGTCIRTDKIPGTKAIPKIELLRLLLEHDGHMDDFGNIKTFTLKPVDPKEIALEKKALANKETRESLESLKRQKPKKGEEKVGVEQPIVDDRDRQRRGVKLGVAAPPPVPELNAQPA